MHLPWVRHSIHAHAPATIPKEIRSNRGSLGEELLGELRGIHLLRRTEKRPAQRAQRAQRAPQRHHQPGGKAKLEDIPGLSCLGHLARLPSTAIRDLH